MCRAASFTASVTQNKMTGGTKREKIDAGTGSISGLSSSVPPPPVSTSTSLLRQHDQRHWGNMSSRPVELVSCTTISYLLTCFIPIYSSTN